MSRPVIYTAAFTLAIIAMTAMALLALIAIEPNEKSPLQTGLVIIDETKNLAKKETLWPRPLAIEPSQKKPWWQNTITPF